MLHHITSLVFTYPHRPPSSWEHSQILWSSHIGTCQQYWCRCHYHTDRTRYDIHQYLKRESKASSAPLVHNSWSLSPASVAQSCWEHSYSPLDRMVVQCRVTPSIESGCTKIISQYSSRVKSTTQWIGPGLEPRLLDPESSALTTELPRLLL